MSLLFIARQSFAQSMEKQFIKEATLCLTDYSSPGKDLIGIEDIQHLPPVVQKYLYYTKFVGKEKIHNMKISFEGRIRKNPDDPWMKLTASQVSSFDNPTRLFFMKAVRMGIPAIGFHRYKNGKAGMKIKLFGLFTVVNADGEKMDQAETVTHFNDMCLMAPGTLIDKSIRWEEIDPLTVRAFYTNKGITISAALHFNNSGELINFISNDRYELSDPEDPKLYPFSTPVINYGEYGGNLLPGFAKTVYSKPDTDFVYGEFTVTSIEYNINNLNNRQ